MEYDVRDALDRHDIACFGSVRIPSSMRMPYPSSKTRPWPDQMRPDSPGSLAILRSASVRSVNRSLMTWQVSQDECVYIKQAIELIMYKQMNGLAEWGYTM